MALKDLNTKQAADKGIDIELYHPGTGVSLGTFITMLGSDSQVFLDADRRISNRQKEQAKRTRDFTVALDYDQQQNALVEKMTACFVGWKEQVPSADENAPQQFKPTIELEEGMELEATKENFKKIISDRGFFWIRQQVQDGMDKVTNFLPSSKGAS